MILETIKTKEQQQLRAFLRLRELIKEDIEDMRESAENEEDFKEIKASIDELSVIDNIYHLWQKIDLNEVVQKGCKNLVENCDNFWGDYVEKYGSQEINTIFIHWYSIYVGTYTDAYFCKYDYSETDIQDFRYNHSKAHCYGGYQNLPFMNLSLLDYFFYELQENAEY